MPTAPTMCPSIVIHLELHSRYHKQSITYHDWKTLYETFNNKFNTLRTSICKKTVHQPKHNEDKTNNALHPNFIPESGIWRTSIFPEKKQKYWNLVSSTMSKDHRYGNCHQQPRRKHAEYLAYRKSQHLLQCKSPNYIVHTRQTCVLKTTFNVSTCWQR